MFNTKSVHIAFHSKHSKLRPRLGARYVTSNPTLQSPHQPIYFFHTPYYVLDKTFHTNYTVIIGELARIEELAQIGELAPPCDKKFKFEII